MPSSADRQMRTIGERVRFPIRRQAASTPASMTKTSNARYSGTIRSPIPPKPKNVVRNIPTAVDKIIPTTHGRTPERNAFAVLPIRGYRADHEKREKQPHDAHFPLLLRIPEATIPTTPLMRI